MFTSNRLCWSNVLKILSLSVRFVRLLLFGALVNAQDEKGATSIMYAAERGHVKVVHLLLDHDADVIIQDRDGW